MDCTNLFNCFHVETEDLGSSITDFKSRIDLHLCHLPASISIDLAALHKLAMIRLLPGAMIGPTLYKVVGGCLATGCGMEKNVGHCTSSHEVQVIEIYEKLIVIIFFVW